MLLKIFLFTNLCIYGVLSGSSGAPSSACTSMAPNHGGNEPQRTALPVRIEVPQEIVAGQLVRLRIVSTTIPSFRGFQIQARNQNGQLIGRFEASEVVNAMSCDRIAGSGATQRNNNPKTEVEIHWLAPTTTTESIQFNFFVTIVENYSTFWVRHATTVSQVVPTTGFKKESSFGLELDNLTFA